MAELVALGALALSVLAACRGDDEPAGDTPTPPAATATARPSATVTVAADTPTPVQPTPGATATPGGDGEEMRIGGHTWVNARPEGGVVAAIIDGKKCAEASTRLPPVGPPVISMAVPPASVEPGCGRAGVVVQLTLNGDLAPQAVPWAPGELALVELVIGPPFGRYGGTFNYAGPVADYTVEPLIDGRVCGEQLPWPRGGPAPALFYEVVVDPAELAPGCGRPGATVELRVRITVPDGATHVAALGSAAWQTDGLMMLPTVDVPPAP